MKTKPPYGQMDKWPIIDWATLQEWSDGSCPCCEPNCDAKFRLDNPLELALRCHQGAPLYVAYWDEWLYLSCAVCAKPAGRIRISTSLLK